MNWTGSIRFYYLRYALSMNYRIVVLPPMNILDSSLEKQNVKHLKEYLSLPIWDISKQKTSIEKEIVLKELLSQPGKKLKLRMKKGYLNNKMVVLKRTTS
jgi:phage pi2 protein 07